MWAVWSAYLIMVVGYIGFVWAITQLRDPGRPPTDSVLAMAFTVCGLLPLVPTVIGGLLALAAYRDAPKRLDGRRDGTVLRVAAVGGGVLVGYWFWLIMTVGMG